MATKSKASSVQKETVGIDNQHIPSLAADPLVSCCKSSEIDNVTFDGLIVANRARKVLEYEIGSNILQNDGAIWQVLGRKVRSNTIARDFRKKNEIHPSFKAEGDISKEHPSLTNVNNENVHQASHPKYSSCENIVA